MLKQLQNDFSNPGAAFRGKPFWSWNGDLEPEELRRQIRVFKEMGMGGFFMHARVGLQTPYMSERWFECVDACVDEAQTLNMEAWLYDEDRWPSGSCGGMVTKNTRYSMRHLAFDVLSTTKGFNWGKDTRCAFTARLNGRKASRVRRVKKGARPKLERGESLVVFREELDQPKGWFNGETYVDTMNPEAVGEFIKLTHEKYKERYAEYFGNVIPGIFTDEPTLGRMLSADPWGGKPVDRMPWTGRFAREFKSRYGYDVLSRVMEVVFDVEEVNDVQPRLHYIDCMTSLFGDAFWKQLGDWCEENNLLLTGHTCSEETLASQTIGEGSVMRSYVHQQAPGIDILTAMIREYDTGKQLGSVGRQFDRDWRLTELYGATGWDLSFLGHKATCDWQAAMGINLRCHHLSFYTMEGEAKRDYPASISFQSPWWDAYAKVEDYFARIFAVMSRGQEVRDLLVVQPLESLWTLVGRGWYSNKATDAFERRIIYVRDQLLAANLDFDYGDEAIMADYGKVGSQNGEAILKVNKAAYSTVLVPAMKTMRSSTLKLLKRFKAKGGQVVFAGEVAAMVDGLPSDAVNEFAKTCTQTPERGKKMIAALEPLCRRISITDPTGKQLDKTLYQLREDKDAWYLFVVNSGSTPVDTGSGKQWVIKDKLYHQRTTEYPEVRIQGFADCAGAPLELDPDSGNTTLARARKSKAGWTIETSLPMLGTRLFVIPKRKLKQKAAPAVSPRVVKSQTLSKSGWTTALTEPNVLVLDRAAYRVGASKAWKKPQEILQVDEAVRKSLGLEPRGMEMVQPWAQEKNENPTSTEVSLLYTFDVKDIPAGPLQIGLEHPGRCRVALNRTPISTASEQGWWVDPSLRLLPTPLRKWDEILSNVNFPKTTRIQLVMITG